MRWLIFGCAALFALGASACTETAHAPARTSTALSSDAAAVGIQVEGLTLRGHLFGDDHKTLVILSHMRQNDETAWFPFAEELAGDGYAALTFNFRGYNGSDGSQDYAKLDDDLQAVVDYVRARGKQTRIFLVGASMGATASLIVGGNEDIAGIIAISPPAKFDSQDALHAVPDVTAPKLFIASENDAPALDFDSLVEAAAEPKEEEVYPGYAHGTDLFDASKNADAASVRERILSFLQEQGGP